MVLPARCRQHVVGACDLLSSFGCGLAQVAEDSDSAFPILVLNWLLSAFQRFSVSAFAFRLSYVWQL
jgi:hypothetical protein